MIKRILVALDSDSDTPVATRYAIAVARRTNARLTGLAVVDMDAIESSARGGGIGSMYYAEKLRDRLTSETRTKARSLLDEFEKEVESAGLDHVETVEEGVPFERIVEDMKYHDLLLIGKDPHFFYAHPKKDTDTLARVIENTIGPSIIVPQTYREVKKVLFATDGGAPSARALRRFIHLHPFGTDVELSIIHVKDSLDSESELYLEMARSYLQDHGFSPKVISMQDRHPAACVLAEAKNRGVDLIVAGAKTSSAFRSIHLGKSTSELIKGSDIPVFIDH